MLPLVCVSSPKKINSRSDIIQINFRRPIFVTSILSSSVFCKHFPSCKVGPSQSACFCVFSISSSHWIFTLLCSFFLSLSLFLSLHDYGSSPSSVMLLIPIGLSISRTLLHPCCRLWIMKNILFPTPLSLYLNLFDYTPFTTTLQKSWLSRLCQMKTLYSIWWSRESLVNIFRSTRPTPA